MLSLIVDIEDTFAVDEPDMALTVDQLATPDSQWCSICTLTLIGGIR